MTDQGAAHPSLAAMGPAARRAVAAAEGEARAHGHDRIGTEHLLLGVLADGGSVAATMLQQEGVALAVVRRKVLEVRPARPGATPPGRPVELTGRAARALGRSVRFSSRAPDGVTLEHLLTGILDVEGTAGQVLRSLGADVDHLRAALVAGAGPGPAAAPAPPSAVEAPVAPVEPAPAPAAPLRCPACGAPVTDGLTSRVVAARGEHGPRDVEVVGCGTCGTVLGAAPA